MVFNLFFFFHLDQLVFNLGFFPSYQHCPEITETISTTKTAMTKFPFRLNKVRFSPHTDAILSFYALHRKHEALDK